MSKIICDVCGTSYPETEVQCPICGTAKTDAAKSTTGGETGYAYVKGGRFSHANVRKRNAGKDITKRIVIQVCLLKGGLITVFHNPVTIIQREAF